MMFSCGSGGGGADAGSGGGVVACLPGLRCRPAFLPVKQTHKQTI